MDPQCWGHGTGDTRLEKTWWVLGLELCIQKYNIMGKLPRPKIIQMAANGSQSPRRMANEF